MIQWPASLPEFPERDGYQENWGEAIVEQNVDSGHTQTRPRFTAVIDEYRVSIPMDGTQVETFRTFWTDDLKFGALRFEWSNPRTGVAEEYKIAPSPRVVPFGVEWRVQMTVRRMP